MAKQNKPAIRFKEFTDAWEQRKLGDCFTERCESMPDGELISVTINDGIKKFSELGRHDNSNDDKSKYKKVCAGDIAYNSMRMWQGASGCSPYEGIVSPAYTVLTPNSGINSKCMAYQFKLPATIHTFKINSQGITSDNWNLKFPALSKIEIYVSPYEQEQAKIAAYFANLDNLITLHQRKYDKLQVLKKAMLEKMFPKNGSSVPEIRFKGFTDAWEQRKAKELCNIGTGKSNTQDQVEDGIYPFYIRSDIPVKSNKYLYDCEAVITIGDGNIGRVFHYVNGKFDLHQRCYKMTDFQDIWGKYFYYFFSTRFYDRAMKMTAKATVDSVRLEMISEMDIWKPTAIDEQKKIAEFFANLDHLITLHQRELEKLQNIKKSMLEKMFV